MSKENLPTPESKNGFINHILSAARYIVRLVVEPIWTQPTPDEFNKTKPRKK